MKVKFNRKIYVVVIKKLIFYTEKDLKHERFLQQLILLHSINQDTLPLLILNVDAYCSQVTYKISSLLSKYF